MQMGTIRGAGMGCACPENTMLRALVTHLLLREPETVIMDMVAGLEHLGRGTAAAVDVLAVDEDAIEADMRGVAVYDGAPRLRAEARAIAEVMGVL